MKVERICFRIYSSKFELKNELIITCKLLVSSVALNSFETKTSWQINDFFLFEKFKAIPK